MTTWAEVSPVTTAWAKPTMPTTAYAEPAAVASLWTDPSITAVANTSFEVALDPALDWTLDTVGSYHAAHFARYATASADDGSYVLRCELEEGDPGEYHGHMTATHVAVPIMPNQPYRVRARVRVGTAAGTAEGSIVVECIDGDGGTITSTSKAWDTLSTSWANLDATFQPVGGILVINLIGITNVGNTRQYPFLVDNVTVTRLAPSWASPTAVTTAWSES